MPAGAGDIGKPGAKPSRHARRSPAAVRRRWLILFVVVVLVVIAILANIGPVTHYQDARARLDKAKTNVSTLSAQKAELQGQLAKLSEAGYLETLAREQLTYVRPGEELYIVTGSPGEADDGTRNASAPGVVPAGGAAQATVAGPRATTGSGVGATAIGDLSTDATSAAASDGASATSGGGTGDGSATSTAGAGDDTTAGQSPGLLERMISAIHGLF
jgi:cell division protein FtsB